jgi:flagellar basal-body rod protein FlgC
MGFFDSLDISASGLTAQRARLDTISENIANVNTTRTANGTPYRRKTVTLSSMDSSNSFASYLSNASNKNLIGNGVKVEKIVEDKSAFKKEYDPGNPDADKNGYVLKPNVEVINEMVNMVDATRAYEANVTAMNSFKSMALKTLDIGK